MVRSVDAKETEDRTSTSSSHLEYRSKHVAASSSSRYVRIIFFMYTQLYSLSHTNKQTNNTQVKQTSEEQKQV